MPNNGGMNKLQSEWQRLYLPHGAEASAATARLTDAEGRVRALVLSLAGPADWSELSRVWQAVQSEWLLPAPAIAVSGVDAYQLWFSLEAAVPVQEARAFLESLRARYLGHIAPARIGLQPAASQADARDSGAMPPQATLPGQWSAFVAPDLAPIFSETPWLDIPPSPDGQAELLSRLQSIKPAQWSSALAQRPGASAPVSAPALAGTRAIPVHAATAGPHPAPMRFLLDVMNDETVALALRIDAAKALLPYMPAHHAP